jgi:hypothetical protein
MACILLPTSEPNPGLVRSVFIRPKWLEDEDVVIEETTPMEDVLIDAEDAKIHIGALVGLLERHPLTYKIESGLFLGNLKPIYARLERLIDGLNAINRS